MKEFSKALKQHMFIDRYIRDLEILREPRASPGTGAAAVSRGKRRQKAPPAGYAKIHVDAGVAARGGVAAAVCRDDQGNYMGSSALGVRGLQDPATLEAIACREGIALAEDLLVQNFILASDVKQVVMDIHNSNHGKYGTIVSEILHRATKFTCNFVFESRDSNNDAHSIAKFARSLGQGRHVWLGQPHDPRCIPLSVAYE